MSNDTYKCTIVWSKYGRKKSVPPNFRYACTTYIKDVDCMLSIIIQFGDNTNEGILTFLSPELLKCKQAPDTSFFLMEGRKTVGIGTFI